MAELRERMARETEYALAFVAEEIEQGRLAEVPQDRVPVSHCVGVDDLYQRFRLWAFGTEGVRDPMGRKAFSDVVARKYPARKSSHYRFHGLVVAHPQAYPQS
jgi:hypothetical protein